jgi:hypothetical protein
MGRYGKRHYNATRVVGIAGNGSVLAEVGAFRAEIVKPPQKHHRSRNADDTTNAPILANTCYQQPLFQIVTFKNK